MLKGLVLAPFHPDGMGGCRPDGHGDPGRQAEIFPVFPDAGGGVRVGEEGPPQQHDGQDERVTVTASIMTCF
jgi:hypothetical protein